MTRCAWCLDNLPAYVDRDLSEEEMSRVRSHLAECPQCSLELRQLEAAEDALSSLAVPVAAPPVLAAVRAKIAEQESRRAARRWWIWIPAPVAAAAVLTLLFIQTGQRPDAVSPLPDDEMVTNSQPSGAEGDVAGAPEDVEPARVAAAPDAPERPVVKAVPHPERVSARVVRTVRAARRGMPPGNAAVHAATVPAPAPSAPEAPEPEPIRSRVVVVSYQPALNYCVSVQDPESGASIAETSVSSSYAPDGTVSRASVLIRRPAPRTTLEDNGSLKNNNIVHPDRSTRGALLRSV